MHYVINKEVTIKSENAARSNLQRNKFLINILENIQNVDVALDYGCGKLRYTIPLCNYANNVVAIDSQDQLSRKQIIYNENTSVIDYAKSIKNLKVYAINEIYWKNSKYDFILCSNVLSAIPFEEDRLSILKNIKSLLKPEGVGLITVQYRNSYFSSFCNRSNSTEYNDGWVSKNKNTYNFYAIIKPKLLCEYCVECGLKVEKIKLNDGSAFIFVTKE